MTNNKDARPRLICYDVSKNRPEFPEYRVTYSNPSLFAGVELKYDYFWTDNEKIIKDYSHFPQVKRLELGKSPSKEETKATLPPKEENVSEKPTEAYSEVAEVEPDSIPDNYAELPWFDLRALALQYTDEKKINKERALEILAAAKGA